MLVLWATFHKEIRKRNPLFIASVLVTWAEERAERQISDKKSLTSQISDKPQYLQISDRKGGTKQFSDTHI